MLLVFPCTRYRHPRPRGRSSRLGREGSQAYRLVGQRELSVNRVHAMGFKSLGFIILNVQN